MGWYLIKLLLISLILTIILEELFALVVGVRNKKDLWLVGMVNILTNPVVVFLYYLTQYCTAWNSTIVIFALEVMAILIEALYYRKYGKTVGRCNWKAIIFSAGANLFSYGSGFLLSKIL